MVNQDSQDQRATKVWVGHLDLQALRVIKAMKDHLVFLDPLDQMVHKVLLALWDPQEV